jgi:gamma-glutamyltranspeptidase/glutathione hydrolase
MVAASQPLAAQAGLRILQQGGNAVDAAVATAAVLAVVEPMMTGPGGDMFALVYWAKSGKLAGINASGFSPQGVDLEFFLDRKLGKVPSDGPFTVTVPGAVDGWATMLAKYGTMSLSQVLAPAIEYAEKGFPVSEIIAGDWARGSEPHRNDKVFAEAYLLNGRPPAHGDVFVNAGLAWTLKQIASGGRDAFYKGEIARKMVKHLNSLDWPITVEDMAYQHSDWVEPISTTYKGYQLFELPPNGQGMAALEMLNILEGFDLKALGHNSSAYLHRLIEAKKLAFADLHRWLADPGRFAFRLYGARQR